MASSRAHRRSTGGNAYELICVRVLRAQEGAQPPYTMRCCLTCSCVNSPARPVATTVPLAITT